jgi:hypothetical protein
MTPAEIEELTGLLTPEERAELDALLVQDMQTVVWRPLPGPQTMAYNSDADVIGFGGAAGGGKTDLACGLALTKHRRTAMFRRVGTELVGIIDRLVELFGGREGYNGQDKIWRRDGLQVELASVPNLGDERGHQGLPKDLLVIDEAANFLEAQVRFLMGWVRTTIAGLRAQTLMTFNPPTSAEGRWVVLFFAPWIDKTYAGQDGRAMPGEIRWVAMLPGENGVSKDLWFGRENPGRFVLVNGEPCWDFDPKDYKPEDIIEPQSRTFIPSRISDNPYLAGTGYMRVLQAMPEPLRSQMLYGDFSAGMEDDAFQVIPTAWVEAAMARWRDRSPKGEQLALGVDVARGGKDNTVIAKRHVDNWYDKLTRVPGTSTPDGQSVVAHVMAVRRDSAPVNLDVIGVGSSPYDRMRENDVQVEGINVAIGSVYRGRSGALQFANLRSELWWRMREELDPAYDTGIALPPDPELLAELCAPRWRMQGKTIYVQSRDEIVKEIGRSPDAATAVILASIETPNLAKILRGKRNNARTVIGHDSIESHHRAHKDQTDGYDPLANY